MSSTSTSPSQSANREHAAVDVLHWRSWPLVDHPRWSWAVPVGILSIGGGVVYLSGSWLAGLVTVAALAAALWQFLLPTTYEVYALGFRRHVLGRTRLVPWHAIRSYRLRATGIVLFQWPDPTAIDVLRSLFLPYPADEDEMLLRRLRRASRSRGGARYRDASFGSSASRRPSPRKLSA